MSLYALYAVLGIASVWDLKTLKIPNALILIGMVLGVTLTTVENGFDGLKLSLIGILVTFLILYPVWALKAIGMPVIGAGDVKLFLVVASFLGLTSTLTIVLYSIILGGCMFLLIIHPKKVFNMFKDFLYLLIYFLPIKDEKKMKKNISFALPILIVVVVYNNFIL